MSVEFILDGIKANNEQIERSQKRIVELEAKLKLCVDEKMRQFYQEEIEKEKMVIEGCREGNRRLQATLANMRKSQQETISERKRLITEWKRQGVKFDEQAEREKLKKEEAIFQNIDKATKKAKAEASKTEAPTVKALSSPWIVVLAIAVLIMLLWMVVKK